MCEKIFLGLIFIILIILIIAYSFLNTEKNKENYKFLKKEGEHENSNGFLYIENNHIFKFKTPTVKQKQLEY
jgi:hypothetical protein